MRSTLLTIPLLLICFAMVSGKEPKASSPTTIAGRCASSFWKPDSKVDVYFMRGLFTADQRRAVLDTMHNSQENVRTIGLAVTFNYAGETDGLIDCENCLTIARQSHAHHRKGQTVINSLRRNASGNMISAWIEIDRETNSSSRLREFIREALRGVRGTKALANCSR
ncbi:MAG TPA: hypothetical protein VNO50_19435 [Pyrinomonadaceae bacterium]|nr:hypothetical protein [Pyrinomonadaceae bacterium]